MIYGKLTAQILALAILTAGGCVKHASIELVVEIPSSTKIEQHAIIARQLIERQAFEFVEQGGNDENISSGDPLFGKSLWLRADIDKGDPYAFFRHRDYQFVTAFFTYRKGRLEIIFFDLSNANGRFSAAGETVAAQSALAVQEYFGSDKVRVVHRSR